MNRLSSMHVIGGVLIAVMISATLAWLWAHLSHEAANGNFLPVDADQLALEGDSEDADFKPSQGLNEPRELSASAPSTPAVELQQRYVSAHRAIDAQAIVDEAWALGLDVALNWLASGRPARTRQAAAASAVRRA